jgi:hypothetical protein
MGDAKREAREMAVTASILTIVIGFATCLKFHEIIRRHP